MAPSITETTDIVVKEAYLEPTQQFAPLHTDSVVKEAYLEPTQQCAPLHSDSVMKEAYLEPTQEFAPLHLDGNNLDVYNGHVNGQNEWHDSDEKVWLQ
jgi:hypothetical protein